ncbi:PREDICTED: uncharacterized protein LOC109359847 [Lupinus angustifolius]|uniref:uncharacterized protein LOC109359847 n=1 Tax=Lupinus angustifolius TaxID=3871 RepID=UPI00092EA44C|nr:PREDICTED: uncharacterized protein LOC109359847 [Lupinus angustifolius]
MYGWNFVSDHQKGLEYAIIEVMPSSHHRNCVLHIGKIFIKCFKDKELRGVVWELGKCTTIGEFNTRMAKLKDKHLMAWSYLNNLEPSSWVEAFYSHWPKVDNITYNMCEVCNAKIVEYRDKPILTMLEKLRCYVMRRMRQHKLTMRNWKGKLLPVQQRRLEKIKVESCRWTLTWTGDIESRTYEVKHRSTKLGISLTNQTCTCQKWQLTRLPCQHVVTAIAFNNDSPEDYVHKWLPIDDFNVTYLYGISLVSSAKFWVSTNQNPKPILPKDEKAIW